MKAFENTKAAAEIHPFLAPLQVAEAREASALRMATIHRVELHWYEAHGVGRKKLKIKLTEEWNVANGLPSSSGLM